MPKIKNIVAYLLDDVLWNKRAQNAFMAIDEELTLKNDVKLKTYIYNILFLKTEIYEKIQEMLKIHMIKNISAYILMQVWKI